MSIDAALNPSNGLLDEVVRIARAAGVAIMEVYGTDFHVDHKPDASPVTAADERAEAIIVASLHALSPSTPVVAEEAASKGSLPTAARCFWLVDPLDGTREFIARNGEFTVNIALVDGGVPVLGVVYVPASDRLYAALPGQGAFVEQSGLRRTLRCRSVPAAGAVVAGSRWHGDDAAVSKWLGARAVAERVVAGSSLKFGLLAEGAVDFYPRFGRTMEWDTAAGHALVLAAGGQVSTLDGEPLRYGKPGYINPSFVASGSPGLAVWPSRGKPPDRGFEAGF